MKEIIIQRFLFLMDLIYLGINGYVIFIMILSSRQWIIYRFQGKKFKPMILILMILAFLIYTFRFILEILERFNLIGAIYG